MNLAHAATHKCESHSAIFPEGIEPKADMRMARHELLYYFLMVVVVNAIVAFCFLFVFVAMVAGPLGSWLDTAVYCSALAAGWALYNYLEDRDLARACKLRKSALDELIPTSSL